MALAIVVKTVPIPDGQIAWPKQEELADKTADVINPSVDMGSAAFWLVVCQMEVKASNNTVAAVLESADALAGTGNVKQVGQGVSLASGVLGSLVPWGYFMRSQQYLNINVTLGGTCTFDAKVWGTPLR